MRMARENSGWGYDRIAGALSNLGHSVSDPTIGNVLRRHDITPAPERKTKTTWTEFIRSSCATIPARLPEFYVLAGAGKAGVLLSH